MDRKVLEQERKKLAETENKVRSAKKDLEVKLEDIGKENLDRLKELRENPETDGLDFFVYLEQLHQKNLSFNLKDRFQRLEELEYLSYDPYFARIDLKKQGTDNIKEVYIGKFGYTEDEPLITDWRAKVASVYYRYRYPQRNVRYDTPDGEITSDLMLKRTYEIDDGSLIRYYNNDLQLDETEIITSKIDQRTGGVLEDIVETIQESQLDIIEEDPRKFCVVQGCVGSGKSTVAIHKLSHIFFNYPHLIRPKNSLLVAKSHVLIGYLSTLFPKLGIFDLNYKTLKELIINTVFREEISQSYDLQDNSSKEIKKTEVMKLLKNIYNIHKETEKRLEKLFKNEDFESFRSYKYLDSITPYENINEIITDLEEELSMQKQQLKEHPKSIRAEIHKDNIGTLKKLITSLQKLRIEIKKKELKRILKTLDIDIKNKLTYQEMLVYLVVYLELVGLQKLKKYEYCVIDEGQDFSLLELLVLKNMVLFNRFCIFGDLNQGYESGGINNWKMLDIITAGDQGPEFFILDTNYRSTKPIIRLANRIMQPYTKEYLPKSIERAGQDPVKRQFSQEDLMYKELKRCLNEDAKDLDKSVGIVCFKEATYSSVKNLIENIGLDKSRVIELNENERINYVPKGVYFTMFQNCKGLEFSKVYVLDLDIESINNKRQAKQAFIAVTRAMNELQIFCVK